MKNIELDSGVTYNGNPAKVMEIGERMVRVIWYVRAHSVKGKSWLVGGIKWVSPAELNVEG